MLAILTPVFVFTILAMIIGFILAFAQEKLQVKDDPVVDQINALLPQTQCGQCGFAGCKPYAEAISTGEPINRCPPGGESTMLALAKLLDRDPEAVEGEKPKSVAVIDENTCIGCTLCIQACPVDAILGAAKQMHTVIAKECTGCELCVNPCPVDCITMVAIEEKIQTWKWPYPTIILNKVA